MKIFFPLCMLVWTKAAVGWIEYSDNYRCTINTYKSDYVEAGNVEGCRHDGRKIQIEWNFAFAMNHISNSAKECKLKVLVCQSFQVGNVSKSVPPYLNRIYNSYVGHSVAVWLKDPDRSIMHRHLRTRNMKVTCFLNHVRASGTVFITEKTLPSGQFSIYIDDRKFQNNEQYWYFLHARLYNSCWSLKKNLRYIFRVP